MFNKTKSAFTLAEVLITLIIIGIVAALTIPTAINHYRKQQTASKLKKFYSTFGQAISRSVTDNGYYSTCDLTGSEDSQRTIDFVNKYVFPYLQIVKNAYRHQTNAGLIMFAAQPAEILILCIQIRKLHTVRRFCLTEPVFTSGYQAAVQMLGLLLI